MFVVAIRFHEHCCVYMPYFPEQGGVPGAATTKFSFLGWKRELETNSVFITFALPINIQIEHIKEGPKGTPASTSSLDCH